MGDRHERSLLIPHSGTSPTEKQHSYEENAICSTEHMTILDAPEDNESYDDSIVMSVKDSSVVEAVNENLDAHTLQDSETEEIFAYE